MLARRDVDGTENLRLVGLAVVTIVVLVGLARPGDLAALVRLLTGRDAELPVTNVLG